MSIPQTHRAVVVVEGKRVQVQDAPVPGKLSDGYDLLVEVHSVALNPTDWKHATGWVGPGAHLGSDFAGTVAEAAGKWKVGDRVAGFTRGGALHNENGAFAQYVRANPAVVWSIPSSLSFEEASAIGGIPADTAALGLFDQRRLGLSWPGEKKSGEWVLVWSGATAVGWYAIQLIKAAGYKVVTTASAVNHDKLKQIGADEVFDYKDADAPKKIRELTGDSLRYGFDTISEQGTTKAASEAFGKDGGKIIVLLPQDKEPKTREGVEAKHILIYSALQKEKYPGDQETIAKFHDILPGLVESGKIKSIKVTKRDGGLDGIQEGLDYHQSGKVRNEKLVYNIA